MVKKDHTPSTEVSLGPLKLKNPVVTASGTFGYGAEYAKFYDLSRLGGITVKGLSMKPIPGNPPPRICETPSGMLNAIGLQNVGVDEFINKKLPFLAQYDIKVIANIFGNTVEEYEAVAARLDRADGVHALEVNISCPNVKKGGMAFGVDPDSTYEVLKAVRQVTGKPVIAKLSPNVTSVVPFAEKAAEAGVDALSLINTLLGMAIDIRTRKPKLANITGGLSGPAIRPVAIRIIWQVHRAVGLPIIGMGGIMDASDAVEFMLAGATAVAVGTANFVNPTAAADIADGIKNYLGENKIEDINQIIGQVQA
ncbi:MAG TPA: dihydroorotate dehydrogenase [Nitrospirota bacterium]